MERGRESELDEKWISALCEQMKKSCLMTCETQSHSTAKQNKTKKRTVILLLHDFGSQSVCFDRYLSVSLTVVIWCITRNAYDRIKTDFPWNIIFFLSRTLRPLAPSISFQFFDLVLAICDVPNFTLFYSVLCIVRFFLLPHFTQNLTRYYMLNETMRLDSIECDLFGSLLVLVCVCVCFISFLPYSYFSSLRFIELLFLNIITHTQWGM